MLLAVQTFIKGKVAVIPRCAMKAYWGEELLLHMLTSDIDRGEQPARGQLLCPQDKPSSTNQTAGWFSLRDRR
jgi:hypothetical protein